MTSKPEIRENVLLKPMMTMRTGGPARFFAEPSSTQEIIELLNYAEEAKLEVFILGAGSNVIASDEGFDGLVIRLSKNFSALEITEDPDDENFMIIKAQAGCPLSRFGNEAAQEGLTGAQFACGIPGSVGGGVFMNAGAYGGEIKDIAVEIEYIEDGKLKTAGKEEAEFGYRSSLWERLASQGHKVVITGLKARLAKGDKEEILAQVAELRNKRTNSQPLTVPSCGSTFKRPEGYFAGKLIEDSGLKGFALDDSGAQVSPKHAGFVVNNGGTASASDVRKLIKYVQDKVYSDSGVRLQTEVRFLGFGEDE